MCIANIYQIQSKIILQLIRICFVKYLIRKIIILLQLLAIWISTDFNEHFQHQDCLELTSANVQLNENTCHTVGLLHVFFEIDGGLQY